MEALVIHAPGDLRVEEVATPELGPGQLQVRVRCGGICGSDLHYYQHGGFGTIRIKEPMVLGHEASGIVREVGPAGPSGGELVAGDHVVFSWVPVCGRCHYCVTGRSALCEPGGEANIAGTLLSGARRFTDSCSPRPHICNHHLGVSAFSQFTVAAQESLVKIDADLPLSGPLFSGAR